MLMAPANFKTQVKNSDQFQSCIPSAGLMLQAVLESLDGILILTPSGEWLDANSTAEQICRRLQSCSQPEKVVPPEIWQICQCLIESRELFPEQNLILFDEIVTHSSCVIRVRVRWIELAQSEQACFLVTLEDHQQSVQQAAIAEAHRYGLTPSETKVWSLYRAEQSYKQIAAALYITSNTVKKHMKSIHAKRKSFLEMEAEKSSA
jgi:DNA-binding CsgD family transcriptional regulator